MNSNIKAVVLDVDGILVGFKNGVNFPMPCLEIVNALKAIKESGIPVILCTGRPFYTPAMKYVIEAAGLDNFHIGEMGCLITNPFSEDVLQCKTIKQSDCRRLARRLLEDNIVTYFSTAEKYYVQKNQTDNEINKLLFASIETLPQVVDSLEESIKDSQVFICRAVPKTRALKRRWRRLSPNSMEGLSCYGETIYS